MSGNAIEHGNQQIRMLNYRLTQKVKGFFYA